MFRPGETVCVSPDKYGYHSIPLESAFLEEVTLVSPNAERAPKIVEGSKLTLVALNPITGFRNDSNCYRYRNFMLELDTGEIDSQIDYIKRLKVPYSAMVFSGNKSVHTLISLTQDLPSEGVYRLFSQWLLNVVTLADQLTKNPSRSLRIAGALRDETKIQHLIEIKAPISLDTLLAFLRQYDHVRPQKRRQRSASGEPNTDLLDSWVKKQLVEGIDFSHGRNKAWFSIACSFCLAGYTEENTVDFLGRYFQPDHDFKESEWLTSIRSAFKYIEQRQP